MSEAIIEIIKNFSDNFLEKIKNNKVHIISHYDVDGITSLAIISKTLKKLNIQFSTKIIKTLTNEEIDIIPKDKIILLLDMGSSSLDILSECNDPERIFIIDHHEPQIIENLKLNFLNPHLTGIENFCSAELTYLFAISISEENKNLAYLAILGMVGDLMEIEINKIRKQIISDANIEVRKGLLIYPSTRPLDKALEFSSRPLIPGVTGNYSGVLQLLNEAGIEKIGKKFKSLIDLDDKEMKSLTTTIMLRLHSKDISEYIGNLYLIKLFNRIEDARELTAMINACSRMGKSETALLLCLGNNEARKKAERLYIKYRQEIISGLRYIEKNGNIYGKGYIIINTKNNIKDTLIGTLASILSFSPIYEEGTIIIAMAYNDKDIKVSARVAGRNSHRNLKEVMDYIISCLGRGISGGHKYAAGCTINMEDEKRFIESAQRYLEYETIKV